MLKKEKNKLKKQWKYYLKNYLRISKLIKTILILIKKIWKKLY